MQFLVKKYVFSMFQSFYTFTLFSLSMRNDNNFLITIYGDSTTYYFSLYILRQKCEFYAFLVKMPIFTSRKVGYVIKNFFSC